MTAFDRPIHVGSPNVGSRDAFLRRVEQMFDRNWLTNSGPLVMELEDRIASRLGVLHCVATCNGTVALELAVKAMGLTGEVIVPAYTFVATAHALTWLGMTPVFADIDPQTHNLDPRSVERAITDRTTGIIGVHLWGRPAPVAELSAIADEFGLQLAFDAAHAFGTSLGGRPIGGNGRAEVLSFHATKFFNTFEGGAVVTNDGELAERVRLMRNFGFAGIDDVVSEGSNGKMPEVCAAMGLANLDSIDHVVSVNEQNYTAYQRAFKSVPGVRMLEYDRSELNNFQYVVLEILDGFPVGRDDVIRHLIRHNVLARKYFWPGCHRMTPYRENPPPGGFSLPATEEVADRVVVLPTGTAVSPTDCARIAELLLEAGTCG